MIATADKLRWEVDTPLRFAWLGIVTLAAALAVIHSSWPDGTTVLAMLLLVAAAAVRRSRRPASEASALVLLLGAVWVLFAWGTGPSVVWVSLVAIPLASKLAAPTLPPILRGLIDLTALAAGLRWIEPWHSATLSSTTIALLLVFAIATGLEHRRGRLRAVETRHLPSQGFSAMRRSAFAAGLIVLALTILFAVTLVTLRPPEPPEQAPETVSSPLPSLPGETLPKDVVLARGRLRGPEPLPADLFLRESFLDEMTITDGIPHLKRTTGHALLIRDRDDGLADQRITTSTILDDPRALPEDLGSRRAPGRLWDFECTILHPEVDSLWTPPRTVWIEMETLSIHPDGRIERFGQSTPTRVRCGVELSSYRDPPNLTRNRDLLRPFTEVPDGFDSRRWLRLRVERWAEGLRGDGALARRIEEELRNTGRTDGIPFTGDYRELVSGLCRGSSHEFAQAAALMARLAGLSARVAVGYRIPLDGPDWVLTAGDAYAWTEIALDELGWVAFDPTPPTPQIAPLTEPRETPEPSPIAAATEAAESIEEIADPNAPSPLRPRFWWPLVFLAVLMFVVLRPLRRRRSTSSKAHPKPPRRTKPWRHWARFLDICARRGLPRKPSQSPREFAATTRAHPWIDATELDHLIDCYERCRFGGGTLAADEDRRLRLWLRDLGRPSPKAQRTLQRSS